ncbi:calponin homology domain-containing protein DDB_G0272472 [Pyrus x bretschneideri]|uniref:calponin homology domain-containing protein DDB_G0272472 n=1 Tax=Pyrus x bretschneideri TaxID=225117 RepID=UPI00202F9FBA|nr:calponin homology domain-containing protein DDB_G0272472 [Pyrus x bretschneideri]
MTAGVDVHLDACESEVSKGEVVNVNVNVSVGNGNGNQSDNGFSKHDTDTDSSYVFVTGSDAIVSQYPVESDPNSSVVQNNGSVVLHSEAQKDNSQSHLLNKAAAEASHLNDGEVVVSDGAETDKDPEVAEEVPLKDASRDLGQETGHDSMPTPTLSLADQVVGDPESKEATADGLPACHAHELNGSSEYGHASSATVIFEDASLQDATKPATQVVNGCVSDQSTGDGLPNAHVPLVTNDSVDAPEENDGLCENADSLEKVAVENGESFSTVADNDIIGDQKAENGVSPPTEDVSTCAVDDVRPELDAVKLTEKSSEVPNPCPLVHSDSEIEAEKGPVIDDTQSSSPPNDAISEPNSKSEIELEIGLVVDDTLSSFPPNDTISKEPHPKSEVEPQRALVVDDTLSSFPPNDTISKEPHPKSEVESERALVVDDTLSSSPPNDARSEEPTSKSEVESESAPVVDDTLPSFPPNDEMSEESNSKAEVEYGSAPLVDDTLPSFPPNDAVSEEPNSKSEVESESAPVVDDNLPSFPTNDAISEEPISRAEVESESQPAVDDTSSFPSNGAISEEPKLNSEVESECPLVADDTLSNFPPNDAISEEPNSKSEVESESVLIIDETLSSFTPNDTISEHNSKSEIELEGVPNEDDTLSSFTANGAISDPKTSHDSVGVDAGLSNLEVECVASPPISVSDNSANEASYPAKPDIDEKLASEVQSTSALRSRAIPDDEFNTSESTILNDSFVENGTFVENGRPLTCNLDDVQIESDVNSTHQEVERTGGILGSEPPASSGEVSTADAVEGQNKGAEVEKRPFYFLIKIPRYDDENLKEEIKQAQLHVEEKTKSRDAIRSKIQMKRATCKEYFDKFEAARSEERAARDLFKAKRKEMDSVQLMINKVKNAISIEDLDYKIRNMEHSMEHETLPLKEEKQFIREIKQLKQLREQLSSSLGKQDEVQEALDQKDHVEQSSKVLRKEMDLLRENLLKAEAVTQVAKKKFNEENNMLNEILSQFRAADDIRQEAYAHLQGLRKKQYEKNKYFWRYKDDAKAANNLALSGDREQLQHLCINQVETVMELWNNNDDFRKEYLRCNNRSTLRRLRTSDGRSLGPDEEPPVIPDIVRATKNNLATVVSTPEQPKQVAPEEAEQPDDISSMKVVQQKNEIAKMKKPVKSASSEIIPETASERNNFEEEKVEVPKLTKEEEELARKTEELRKEEAEARLREQRRLEEKAKAKEAQERKKRIAEKAQARAAIRAQKEAEEKEKEREKRIRKKERKMATTTKATNDISEVDCALEPSSEAPTEILKEPETREKPVTVTKRSQKSSQLTKQTKVKSMPLPLRNRSKRRMQPWMWAVVAIVLVVALFLLGNGGSSYFKATLEKFF